MNDHKKPRNRSTKVDLSMLNEEQRAAVTHEKGPLLLIAGAGTGKTTVIAHKILWLIQERDIRPDNILALTFTEKTAAEMEDRVDRLLPMGLSRVRIATFHGYCERLLRDYAIEIGLDPSFKILTVPEQWLLVRRHLFDLPLNYFRPLGNPTKFLQQIVRAIGAAKDQDLMPERFTAFASVLDEEGSKEPNDEKKAALLEEAIRWREFGEVYRAYQQIILSESAMDFGDIILNAVRLLKDRPSVAARVRGDLSEVLVDEFQDTNGAQNALLKLLVPDKNGQITVVGDDDQSIYAWRGSNILNILTFQEWYPEAKKIVLTKNYRSPQSLLDAAYEMIQHNNPMRLEKTAGVDKRLTSAAKNKNDISVTHHNFGTVDEECAFIAEQILHGVEKQGRSFNDYAILLRTNSQPDIVIPALVQKDIIYHVSDARGLLLRPEVRDVLSYLRMVLNPLDNTSIFRLLSHEIFNLAPYERQRLLSECRHENISIIDKLRTLISQQEYSEQSREGAKKFLELLDLHVGNLVNIQPSRVVIEFIQKSGYLEWAIKNTEKNPEILPNISELVKFVREYERSDSTATIISFLDYLELVISSGESPAQASLGQDYDAVRIQTVHSAKGLEFPIVFIFGATADKYPVRDRSNTLEIPDYFSDIKEVDERDSHLQEERRLFYVAMTRAKEKLFITSAELSGTGKSKKKISRFIKEANIETTSDKGITFLQQLKLPIVLKEKTTKRTVPLVLPKSISVSQVETYETCPLKYKFQYIYRIPVPQSHALTFGITVHTVLRELARRVVGGEKTDVQDGVDLYNKYWSGEGFEEKIHEENQKVKGESILRNYLEKNPYLIKTKPLYVEEDFKLRVGDIAVKGRIDRVDKIDELVTVTDFKTGTPKDQKYADADLQLSVYAIALKEVFGINADRLVLSYLDGPIDRRTVRNEKTLEQSKQRLTKAAENISEQNFEAKPNPMICHFCQFKNICDYSTE